MRFSMATTRLIGRALIGLFACAQIVVAAHACPVVVDAMNVPSAGMTAAVHMPGCDRADGTPRAASAPCAGHCSMGQQTIDSHPAPMLLAPPAALLYVVSAPADAHGGECAAASTVDPLLAATPPPHAILHCVLRI